MSDIEQRIQILEARIEISELRYRYCWYTARGMKEEVFALFTEDCLFQNFRTPGGVPAMAKGKDELRKMLSQMAPGRRVPIISNEVTHVNGDVADGTCIMYGLIGESFGGHYIDEFKRLDGKWLFQSRSFYPYWPTFAPSPERAEP